MRLSRIMPLPHILNRETVVNFEPAMERFGKPRYMEHMGWTHIAPRIEFVGNPDLNNHERANIIRRFRCLFEDAEVLFLNRNFKGWKV